MPLEPTLCLSLNSLDRGALMITRRTPEGALKCALRDFLREEWRAGIPPSLAHLANICYIIYALQVLIFVIFVLAKLSGNVVGSAQSELQSSKLLCATRVH